MKMQYSQLLDEKVPVGNDIPQEIDVGLSVMLFHAGFDPPFVRWIDNLIVDFAIMQESGYDFIYISSGKRQQNYLQKLITNDKP